MPLHIQMDPRIRGGYQPAFRIHHLHRQVQHVATISGELRPVRRHCERCRRTCGLYPKAAELLVLAVAPYRLQHAWLIRHLPQEVQVRGGGMRAMPFRRPAQPGHPGSGEHVGLDAQRTPVEEQLHLFAVCIADHGNGPPLLPGPVPVRRQVDHGLASPLAAIKVIAVFEETAGVDYAARRVLKGPARLSQIVNARPHEIAGHIVMERGELP